MIILFFCAFNAKTNNIKKKKSRNKEAVCKIKTEGSYLKKRQMCHEYMFSYCMEDNTSKRKETVVPSHSPSLHKIHLKRHSFTLYWPKQNAHEFRHSPANTLFTTAFLHKLKGSSIQNKIFVSFHTPATLKIGPGPQNEYEHEKLNKCYHRTIWGDIT